MYNPALLCVIPKSIRISSIFSAVAAGSTTGIFTLFTTDFPNSYSYSYSFAILETSPTLF